MIHFTRNRTQDTTYHSSINLTTDSLLANVQKRRCYVVSSMTVFLVLERFHMNLLYYLCELVQCSSCHAFFRSIQNT